MSHYLFEDRFGRPGKGNDKGKVEGLVGYARRNFLVPVSSLPSFDELNAHLREKCLERLWRRIGGHKETIEERMALPAVPYDASDKHTTRVSSLSLVRSRMGKRGKREYVQVLRLMENFRKEEVHEAVKDALKLGAINFDAIKHLLLSRMEGRTQRLDLELYPHLPRVSVTKTAASDYMALLSGRTS